VAARYDGDGGARHENPSIERCADADDHGTGGTLERALIVALECIEHRTELPDSTPQIAVHGAHSGEQRPGPQLDRERKSRNFDRLERVERGNVAVDRGEHLRDQRPQLLRYPVGVPGRKSRLPAGLERRELILERRLRLLQAPEPRSESCHLGIGGHRRRGWPCRLGPCRLGPSRLGLDRGRLRRSQDQCAKR
jgi:hypothetical protein